jgi:polyhydroxybutyrate depolymerase
MRIMYKLISIFAFCSNLYSQININDSIVFQSRNRIFIIHIPADFSTKKHVPLVFILHGGSGKAQGMINFSQFDLVSDTAGFVAVFPQGGAITAGGYSWADGRGTNADSLGIDDVGFINSLINYMFTLYNIDTNKVYVTGISNGGFMSQRLACELNNRIAAVASVSSTMDTSFIPHCKPDNSVPMLIMNGTSDPFVPYIGGTMSTGQIIISTDSLVSFWMRYDKCSKQVDSIYFPNIVLKDSSTVHKYIYNHCDSGFAVLLYEIIGGGHTWPGVPNKIYEIIAGHTNEDIHASVEIWKFFKQYHKKEKGEINALVSQPYEINTIYPNPTSGIINIIGDNIIKINVFDIYNNFQGAFYGKQIDISSFTSGLYILNIYSMDGTIRKEKIVLVK